MSEVMTRGELIENMCFTMRHDFGLLSEVEQNGLRVQMKQLLIHDIDKYIESKKCSNCKHWKRQNEIVVSGECFIWSGNVMTDKNFSCNRWTRKEEE